MRIDVWHNIMWSRYKAEVFSELYTLSHERNIDVSISHIAETDADRATLSPVDLSCHQYPYTCLFKGSYWAVSLAQRTLALGKKAAASTADLTILAGYDRIEYWVQALVLLVRRKKFATFCDSTIADNPQTYWKGLAKKLFFSLADGAFCYGERSAAYVQHYGMNPKHIASRCQAAALPKGYEASAVLSQRLAVRAQSPSPRYLYVGRLSKEKRIETLLHAFAAVLSLTPAAKLVVVGRGPEDNALKTLARQLGLEASVDFTGAKYDKALCSEYLQASCLVLPSYSEPWGLVVNEALSFGCPVVVSDRCGCVPELIIEGKTGFTFHCDDVTDLAAKLVKADIAFADTATVAPECINHIASYNPHAAAQAILNGALSMIAG